MYGLDYTKQGNKNFILKKCFNFLMNGSQIFGLGWAFIWQLCGMLRFKRLMWSRILPRLLQSTFPNCWNIPIWKSNRKMETKISFWKIIKKGVSDFLLSWGLIWQFCGFLRFKRFMWPRILPRLLQSTFSNCWNILIW